MDEVFVKFWMNGFEKGIGLLDEKSRNLIFENCAKNCADSGVLEKHRNLFEKCSHDLDQYYSRLSEIGGVDGHVIESGKIYEEIFPECGCNLHTECGVNSPVLCQCSIQSILYVAKSVTGRKNVSVKCIENVLSGGKKCRFRIEFE